MWSFIALFKIIHLYYKITTLVFGTFLMTCEQWFLNS